MTSALERPGPASLVTHWNAQPIAILTVIALAAGYAYGLRRLRRPWPARRTATFAAGLVVLIWTSCGFPQVYASSLYWIWLSQTIVLWLVVPLIILFGQPVQLARAICGPDGRVDRVLRTRPVRIVANPLIGPALVPILSFALFFGPIAGWSIATPAIGWLIQLAVLLVGSAMVLPLVGLDEDASSLAVGLGLAIGCFELVLDAVPGIVLRLNTHLTTSWFDHRTRQSWAPRELRDQQVAGAILWTLAEVIDLPFLWLVFRRWIRADARDAARVDAVLEAERAARHGLGDQSTPTPDDPDRDTPWWVSDPAMQQRLRRRG